MRGISKTDAISIAIYMAKKYAALGIKNIDVNEDGDIVVTYADDSTSIISGALFMVQSVYDVYNRGKVDMAQDSEKLGGQLPVYYTVSNNITYDNDISGLTAETVKLALDEIVNILNNIKQPPLSSGLTTLPTFTDNGNGTFTVGNATARIFVSSDFVGDIVEISVMGKSFTPTDNLQSYLVINYNNNEPVYQLITNVELINESTIIPVYSIYRSGNDLLPLNWDRIGLGLSNKLHQRLVKTRRFERESGLMLSETSGRIANISEGILWYGAVRNILSSVNSTSDICHLHYHLDGVYTKTEVLKYNNMYYDNGTDLVLLNNNYYTVNWIYRAVEDGKHMGIVLGDKEYNQLSLAVESQPRTDLPDVIKSSAILIGRIIVQKGAMVAAKIESAFETTFITAPINTHNDLASLQGGTINEYYHLTNAEYNDLSNFAKIKRFGFTDLSETTISFDGVNTFTLAKTGDSWSYFRNGDIYTITTNKTVTLSDTPPASTGMYFIYINNDLGDLVASTTPWSIEENIVFVAILTWNNALTPKFQLSEERHTCLWDRQAHRYHHLVDGTKLISGGILSGYTLNSTTDTNKVFGISQTVIADEDLFLTLASLTKPDGVSPAYVNVYRNGLNNWIWNQSNMPFKYTTTGFIEYDDDGVMTPITNNNFCNTYLLVSNIQGAARYIILSGHGLFSNATSAYAERFETFDLTGFVTAESVALYQLTWKGVNNGNTGQCELNRVQQITANIVSTNVSGVINHNGLDGLQGGGAGEFYHFTQIEHADLLANKFWALLGIPANLLLTTEYQKIVNTDTLKVPADTNSYFTLSGDKKDITCLKTGMIRITRTLNVASISVPTILTLIPTINTIQTSQCLAQEQQISVTTTTKDIGYSYYLSVQANDVVSLWAKGADASTLAYNNARTTIEYI